MKLHINYILLFLFLAVAGFSFTGHNKAPLQLRHVNAVSITCVTDGSDAFRTATESVDFTELSSCFNEDNREDESDAQTSSLQHRVSILFAYFYQSLFLPDEKSPVDNHRYVWQETAVEPVPLFILFHSIQIPYAIA
ncbi:MAG TPA: hypothetical protein VM802_04370 [Chitinophaga sp.]|uniref:hypothetical protein n=1 Tax=Chitinophaga sp. TaxID=1869181 RepID=UPI002C3E2D20|nr:hypothetical protein [Chitinophaga sp.]HVI44073.1 hypothetical protein [Chitinophaga sp.]